MGRESSSKPLALFLYGVTWPHMAVRAVRGGGSSFHPRNAQGLLRRHAAQKSLVVYMTAAHVRKAVDCSHGRLLVVVA